MISRKTNLVKKTFVSEKFFFLHIINQYETAGGEHVILDVCCYRDSKMLDCMYIDVLKVRNFVESIDQKENENCLYFAIFIRTYIKIQIMPNCFGGDH